MRIFEGRSFRFAKGHLLRDVQLVDVRVFFFSGVAAPSGRGALQQGGAGGDDRRLKDDLRRVIACRDGHNPSGHESNDVDCG